MKIKTQLWKSHPWLAVASSGIVTAIILLACLRGTSQPAMTISLLSTNQLLITITNATPGQAYEIQRRLLLDPLYPWQTYLSGASGQTSFVADIGIDLIGFFAAISCTDCDHDGVPNWADPQPNNSAISNLVVTIDTPANGSIVP